MMTHKILNRDPKDEILKVWKRSQGLDLRFGNVGKSWKNAMEEHLQ